MMPMIAPCWISHDGDKMPKARPSAAPIPTRPLAGPSPEVDLQIRAKLWRDAVPDLRKRARQAVLAALVGAQAANPSVSVALLFADDATIQTLNRNFRHKDRATNVLAFPSPAALPGSVMGRPLGDVVLAAETVIAEAEAAGKPIGDHVSHLLVHGVLHLLGHDHERAGEAKIMERLEVEILASLGIPDPYAGDQAQGVRS